MPTPTLALLFVAGAFGLVVLAMLRSTFFTVEQRTTAIVQRFGKFLREAGPGMRVKIPSVDRVVGVPGAPGGPLSEPTAASS